MATTKQRRKTNVSGKRELIAPKGERRYIKRNGKGRTKESDDQSGSSSRESCRIYFDFEELP